MKLGFQVRSFTTFFLRKTKRKPTLWLRCFNCFGFLLKRKSLIWLIRQNEKFLTNARGSTFFWAFFFFSFNNDLFWIFFQVLVDFWDSHLEIQCDQRVFVFSVFINLLSSKKNKNLLDYPVHSAPLNGLASYEWESAWQWRSPVKIW